jgi:hypothetical protein
MGKLANLNNVGGDGVMLAALKAMRLKQSVCVVREGNRWDYQATNM